MSKPQEKSLEARRSWLLKANSNITNNSWKSDICISRNKGSYTIIKTATASNITETKHKHKDYYKRYEYDEVPVKDSDNRKTKSASPVRAGDISKNSFTNSDLDRLEQNVYKNLSQDLQMQDGSASSLESNIKYFKATVQDIFDNFQSNMRDYELYKKKLAEILTKTKADSMAEMENFIKEMIQSIVSSESSVISNKTYTDNKVQVEAQNETTNGMQGNASQTDTVDTNATSGNVSYDESVHLVVEAYKNDNYLTDSTLNENNSKSKSHAMDKGALNVYLLSSTPCVIKMNNRNLLSEINIKDSSAEGVSSYVASTENIKKMAAKKIELEQYELQHHDMSDRDIPVKVSFAKKNLCSSDDGVMQKEIEDNCRSFMSRICSYICKKFRKTAL